MAALFGPEEAQQVESFTSYANFKRMRRLSSKKVALKRVGSDRAHFECDEVRKLHFLACEMV